jgi:hypothetical protein
MKNILQRRSTFLKKDISEVTSDWDGSETYWTRTGKEVLTTDPLVDTTNTAVIRFLESDVSTTGGEFDLDFPDDDSYSAGTFNIIFEYPLVTKREIHILTKNAIFPTELRIDYYNGTTKLLQIYKFQVTSDPTTLKYGIRVRVLEPPSDFHLYYGISDDQYFESMGLLIERENEKDVDDYELVDGITYFPSMPVAYVPGGLSRLGYASDYAARIISLVALLIGIIAIIYMTMYLS